MSSGADDGGGGGATTPTTEEGWRTVLTANQFAVLREKATEPGGFSENREGEVSARRARGDRSVGVRTNDREIREGEARARPARGAREALFGCVDWIADPNVPIIVLLYTHTHTQKLKRSCHGSTCTRLNPAEHRPRRRARRSVVVVTAFAL